MHLHEVPDYLYFGLMLTVAVMFTVITVLRLSGQPRRPIWRNAISVMFVVAVIWYGRFGHDGSLLLRMVALGGMLTEICLMLKELRHEVELKGGWVSFVAKLRNKLRSNVA